MLATIKVLAAATRPLFAINANLFGNVWYGSSILTFKQVVAISRRRIMTQPPSQHTLHNSENTLFMDGYYLPETPNYELKTSRMNAKTILAAFSKFPVNYSTPFSRRWVPELPKQWFLLPAEIPRRGITRNFVNSWLFKISWRDNFANTSRGIINKLKVRVLWPEFWLKCFSDGSRKVPGLWENPSLVFSRRCLLEILSRSEIPCALCNHCSCRTKVHRLHK